jgi:molecular chaperone DnaJ
VTVKVTPHPVFRREGANLALDVPVTYAEAVQGTTVRVPTLTTPVTLKIAPGTAPGKRLRVRGRGFPSGSNKNGTGRGDLLVTVQLSVPSHLSPKAAEALSAYAAATEEHPRAALDRLAAASEPASAAS